MAPLALNWLLPWPVVGPCLPRVMSTLGELLFYVATQQQDSGGCSVDDASQAWGITPDTITAVAHLLRPGEDEVCQHYAVKTIENICSQGGEWAGKFARQVRRVVWLMPGELAGAVGVSVHSHTLGKSVCADAWQ